MMSSSVVLTQVDLPVNPSRPRNFTIILGSNNQVSQGETTPPHRASRAVGTCSPIGRKIANPISLEKDLTDSAILLSKTIPRWFENVQNYDGGIPSDAQGSPNCGWVTAGAIWATASVSQTSPEWLDRALAWLLANTNPDGGIPIYSRGSDSLTDATAHALLALQLLGGHYDASAALSQSLVATQKHDGPWSWRATDATPSTCSTVFAVLALAVRSTVDATLDAKGEKAAQWLRSIQHPDGSVPLTTGAIGTPASTGLALIVYKLLGADQARAAARDHLLQTRAKRAWPIVIERPSGHTILRNSNAYALLGLLYDADEPSRPRICSSLRRYFESVQAASVGLEAAPGTRTWPTRDLLLVAAMSLANQDRLL